MAAKPYDEYTAAFNRICRKPQELWTEDDWADFEFYVSLSEEPAKDMQLKAEEEAAMLSTEEEHETSNVEDIISTERTEL